MKKKKRTVICYGIILPPYVSSTADDTYEIRVAKAIDMLCRFVGFTGTPTSCYEECADYLKRRAGYVRGFDLELVHDHLSENNVYILAARSTIRYIEADGPTIPFGDLNVPEYWHLYARHFFNIAKLPWNVDDAQWVCAEL